MLLATSPSATAAAPSVVSEILSNRRRAVQASAGPRCVYANETCHAGRARDFACADGCGLCAPEPLPNELPVCTRPCGLHQLKMRGVGGKLVRESIGLAVFPRDAVTQSEGWTLGNAGTRRALDSAAAAGMKTVVVLRHPIARILGRCVKEDPAAAAGAATCRCCRHCYSVTADCERGRCHLPLLLLLLLLTDSLPGTGSKADGRSSPRTSPPRRQSRSARGSPRQRQGPAGHACGRACPTTT